MTRRAVRRSRQLRDEWIRSLTSSGPTTRYQGGEVSGRGSDYEAAPDRWVCNRKKSYPSRADAERVADRLNEMNRTKTGRPEYYGVTVVPYSCGRCGSWHIGR